MKAFVGIFAERLTNFVNFKQSLGFKYKVEADELYRFSMFTTTFPLSKPILTKEIVQAWCAKRVPEGVRNSRRRAYPVRQFALYLNSMGLDAYIMPPGTNTCHYTFIPYIFTHTEIERIFTNSDRLCPCRNSTISFIVPVILRILYSCGLRISEAVSLQNKHVNFQERILEVKNSKFGNGVADVVQFQIEKDLLAGIDERARVRQPARISELIADFVESHRVAEPLHHGLCRLDRRNIEGDNQALARR